MWAEGGFILVVLSSCGIAALLVGLKPWARHSAALWGSVGGVAAAPMLVLYTNLDKVSSVGPLTTTLFSYESSFREVGMFYNWQYSLLVACLLPSLLFCFLLLTRPLHIVRAAGAALAVLIAVGLVFVFAASLFMWLLAFELLLLVSLYLLRLTSKSERIAEAVAEMFFWTLTGSICLLLGFTLAAAGGVGSVEAVQAAGGLPTLTGLLFLLGFGVKLPIWPCFSWLLRAHVEASVEFSILLSGLVVKFGALGLYRTLQLQATPTCGYVLLACSTLAILEATLRLLGQRDLKRIVALTTVIELNWVGVCLGLGGALFEQVGALVLVAHSFTTAAEFFSVECLYRRYGARDIAAVSGVAYAAPQLFAALFLTTLTTIGFPASSLFAAKLFFLTAVAPISATLCFGYALIFVLILPVVFLRIWVPVWFGQPHPSLRIVDLSAREGAILLITVMGSLALGLWPALALESL